MQCQNLHPCGAWKTLTYEIKYGHKNHLDTAAERSGIDDGMDGNKNNASDARTGRPSTLVMLDMEDFTASVAGRGVKLPSQTYAGVWE
ncbi:unnamed protein product [Linum trigynum]|uniref:Uncharacterized protein n=1 Tax=Linum trigynum TaxID=586398 RepID=A0AAV2GKM5_9ROSI